MQKIRVALWRIKITRFIKKPRPIGIIPSTKESTNENFFTMSDDTKKFPCICMQSKALGKVQTAKLHGMNVRILYEAIRSCHPELVRKQSKTGRLQDVDVEECAKLLAQGYTLSRLSREFGLGTWLLRKALTDAGKYTKKPPPFHGKTFNPVRHPRELPQSIRLTVASSQGWKCKDCQEPLSPRFEVDHLIPLCEFGSNHIENLAAKCASCHSKKTARETLERSVKKSGYRMG